MQGWVCLLTQIDMKIDRDSELLALSLCQSVHVQLRAANPNPCTTKCSVVCVSHPSQLKSTASALDHDCACDI